MPFHARALTSFVLLIATCAACSSTTTPTAPPMTSAAPQLPATSAPPDPTDCRARIEDATFDDLATIERVAECRFTRDGVDAAAAVLVAGGSTDVVWSALWVHDVTSADPVRRYLTNDNASIRAMAAAILARLGERDALDTLGELAVDDALLLGSHPPVSIGEFAIRSLARVIAAPDTPSADVDRSTLGPAAKAWQGWLDVRVGQLRYDTAAAEWNS